MDLIVSPHIAGTEHSDYRFHQFVEGLITGTVNAAGNVLELAGDDAFLYDHNQSSSMVGHRLFLRPVYAPLTELIDQGLESGAPVMISGTPGVGKTTMRNFYLRHLLHRPFAAGEEVRTIIMQGSETPSYHMIKMERIPPSPPSSPASTASPDAEVSPPASPPPLSSPSSTPEPPASPDAEGIPPPPPLPPVQVRVTATKGRNFMNQRFDVAPVGNVFILVDVAHHGECKEVDEPSQREDKLVVFTSPSNKASSRFGKFGLLTYYMPLWTFEELVEANTALGLTATEAAIRDRYDMIGGMARFVLFRSQMSFSEYYMRTLPSRATDLGLSNTADLINATTFTGSKEFLHSLAYFFVTKLGEGDANYNFSEVSIRWGTKYIITEVVAKRWHDDLTEKMRNTPALFVGMGNPAMVGYVYEGWALRKLQVSGLAGMKWQFRRGNNLFRSRFKQLFGEGQTFHGEFDIRYAHTDEMAARVLTAPPRTLIVPTSFQYPVIDCVMKSQCPTNNEIMLYVNIQITVAHDHAISPAGETFLTTLMNNVFTNSTDAQRPGHVRDRSAVFYLVPPLQYRSFVLPATPAYRGQVVKLTLEDL